MIVIVFGKILMSILSIITILINIVIGLNLTIEITDSKEGRVKNLLKLLVVDIILVGFVAGVINLWTK